MFLTVKITSLNLGSPGFFHMNQVFAFFYALPVLTKRLCILLPLVLMIVTLLHQRFPPSKI